MQPLFQSGGLFSLRLLLLAVLSAALMVADHRDHYVDHVRAVLFTALTPLQYAADLPVRAGRWTLEALTLQRELHQRIDQLERENLQLRARQQRFETVSAENARLRRLLKASQRRDERVLVGELLAVDLDPFRQHVIVDRGSRTGVYRGQPVIDAEGVMGQVINTGPYTATVLLISDPDHALPVQINRTGLRTIAAGTGEASRINLLYIPNNADIRVGDLVITSGLGGRFPANYPVGRITHMEQRPGEAFAEVRAEPLADLDRSREVLLVWPDADERAAREAAAEAAEGEAPEAPPMPATETPAVPAPAADPALPADVEEALEEQDADDSADSPESSP